MSRNGVAGFNILDDNFSRDVSELDISELSSVPLEKRFRQTIKKNVFKEVARGSIEMPLFRSVEGFYANNPSRTYPDAPTNVQVTLVNNSILQVTWDAADTAGGTGQHANLSNHFIFLKKSNGQHIYIYTTSDRQTLTYGIELDKTYNLSSETHQTLTAIYSIEPDVFYSVGVKGADVANYMSNNNNSYTDGGPVGYSSEFKLIPTGPPTGLSAVAGNASATINWTAPALPSSDSSNFYIKNKGYKIGCIPNDGSPAVSQTISATSNTDSLPTSKIISSLKNTVRYDIYIRSVSYIAGKLSTLSEIVRVTPSAPATKPDPPVITSVIPGFGSATVNWTPGNDGGSPITHYDIFVYTSPSLTGNYVSFTDYIPSEDRSARVPALGNVGVGAPLINGNSYTFVMKAYNRIYDSTATPSYRNSEYSSPFTITLPVVSTPPDSPTNVRATALDESATVSWDTPVSIGSSNITGYTVIVYKGTSSSSEKTVEVGVTNTTTVTALTNGTSYRFKITATNLQQTSNPSSFSAAITPAPAAAAPGLPTSVSATAGDGSATVSWRAPLSSGTSAITKYTVTVYAADTNTELKSIDINGTAAILANTNSVGIISIPVTDLTNGNSYIFKITATNSQLTSEFASTPTLNPVSSVTNPGAPTIISVARGDKSIIVRLNPVSADLTGGKPIIKYTVSVYTSDSATAVKSVEFSGSTINTNPILATVTGLINGTAYTFKATATNESNLTSEYSPSSPSIEPDLAPGPPAIISATPGDKSATITWDPPTPNGGTPIREYRVSSDKGQFVDVSGNITTATMDKLFNNTLYKFTVIAKNSFLIGPPSTDSDSIKPSAASSLSGPPTELQATVASDKKVSLTWGPPITFGGATSVTYNVYVCSDNFCNSKINTINDVTSYTTDSLTAGTYYFHVMAVNSYGTSNPAKKSVTILGEHTDISGVTPDISGATPDISGVTPSIIGGIISGMNTKTSLSYILSTPPKKDEDEEEDISGVKVSTVSGIVKPLSLYGGLSAYQSDPMTSMLIAVVLLGGIFMALFSSYSPIRIKNFYR